MAGKTNLTVENGHALAKIRSGKFLSEIYINCYTKYTWECVNKHIFQASYTNVKSGWWCAECSGIKKHTIEDCQRVAEFRKGKCLSPSYKNAHTKLLWECERGHQWWSKLVCVLSNNSWCPYCVGKAKHTIDECCKLATQNNGKCLSTEYKNSYTKLLWRCAEGHEWYTTFSIINQGCWCNICSVGKTQRRLGQMLKKILNMDIELNSKKFDWLKTSKSSKMELDIYVPKIKLAVEYDGRQHFEPVLDFGGPKEFLKIKDRDLRKNQLISEHPEDVKCFIRISYRQSLSEDNIRKILKENNIEI